MTPNLQSFLCSTEKALSVYDVEKEMLLNRKKVCSDQGKNCNDCFIKGECDELTAKLFPKGGE